MHTHMHEDELERALRALESASGAERLAGARSVLRHASELSPQEDERVRRALAQEDLPWIRGVLLELLTRGSPAFEDGVVVSAPSWDERLDSIDPDLARQCLNMSARRVLHEVSSVVGRVKVVAKEELSSGYHDSETAEELTFLSEVCTGLRTLAGASEAPTCVEFELSQELEDIAAAVSRELVCSINATGPAPFLVTSDRGLLSLAVRNVLVNAVEATLAIGPTESRPIMLTWGSSPGGTHTTIIDRGPGPPQFLATSRSAGVSTKEGHPGYGLATASEAMRSLGGQVRIHRNDRGGTTVVLSWRDQDK